VVGILIIPLGWTLLTLPRDRLLLQEDYTSPESYPTYYYVNFTVDNSEMNPQLSFDIELDFAGNYSSFLTSWCLYQLSPAQFEQDFNVTEVRESMSGENWTHDAYWSGWFFGYHHPFWEPIPPGEYILVFWIQPSEPVVDLSITLTASLRTSLFPMM
jgi:hypothetical protein